MSDLVERLRMADQETPYLFDLISGAADEIVRLQKLVEEMTDAMMLVLYDDNGEWKIGQIGDTVVPEELSSVLSKALSYKEETK